MSNHVKWQSSIGVSNVWAPKVLSVRTCPPKIPAHIDWIDWWWIAATVLAFRLGSLLKGSEKTKIKNSYIAFEFVIIHQIMLSWLDLSIQHKQTFPSWIAATIIIARGAKREAKASLANCAAGWTAWGTCTLKDAACLHYWKPNPLDSVALFLIALQKKPWAVTYLLFQHKISPISAIEHPTLFKTRRDSTALFSVCSGVETLA